MRMVALLISGKPEPHTKASMLCAKHAPLTLGIARHRCQRGGGELHFNQGGAIRQRCLHSSLRLPHSGIVV